jgi:hypothetical protein
MMKRKRTCLICCYHDMETGYCKRYAPRHISGVGTGYEEHLWPRVDASDWCGEWAGSADNVD